jgi:hypothetical protein
MGAVDADAIADALYGLPVDRFVERRDAYVKEAKAAGEPDVAKAVAALRRPTSAARVVNLIVREHHAELLELMELGAALREAQDTLASDDLKRFSRQRLRAVKVLASRGFLTSLARGETVGTSAMEREVLATLNAAVTDPDAAEEVLTGRLVKSLDYAGLGFENAYPKPPRAPREPPPKRTPKAPVRPRPRSADPAGDDDEAAAARAALDAAERDLAQARLQAADAEARAEAAQARRTAAESAIAETAAELDDARAEVARLEEGLAALEVERDSATQASAAAATAAAEAAERAAQAAETLETLRTSGV